MRLFETEKMKPEERKEAARLIEQGKLAKEFFDGQFWVQYLGPFLRDEYYACGQKSLFNPVDHKASIEAIAIQLAFNSGMAKQIDKLKEELSIWITKGEDARKELEKDNELLAKGDRR